MFHITGEHVILVKDIVNIAFFVIVSVVTVLSYFHAKRTLFAPIRTETYKLQLQVLQEIFAYFQHCEQAFLSKYDMHNVFTLNAEELINQYIETFFKGTLEYKRNPEDSMNSAGILVHISDPDIKIVTDHLRRRDPTVLTPTITDPAMKLAEWARYRHGGIRYTNKYFAEVQQLTALISSPVLPSDLRKLLVNFKQMLTDETVLIGSVLTKAASEFPEKYPDDRSVLDFSPIWLWNRYNHERKHVEHYASTILQYLSDYFDPDNLRLRT